MPILDFENTTNTNNRIKVIGVGGGGGNAVKNMFNEGITDVDFIVVNTDAQALKRSPIPVKIQIGETGLGAGNSPQVAKDAAQKSIEEIKTLLEDTTDMVFITAGMGGGTGTGAAPVIASLAKELGILTVGIVTLPFSFEGPKRIAQAEQGIEELKEYVDTIIVIINDKIREIHQDMRFSEGFKLADNILTIAAKGIAELITIPGYVNVDFEDVKQVMKNGGKALMTSGTASGDTRALECCENALNSPLIADNSIEGAENILLNIVFSEEHEMSMNELNDIMDYLKDASGAGTNVIWGSCFDNELGDQLKVTIIATGFDKNKSQKQDNEKEVIDLYSSPTPAKEKTIPAETTPTNANFVRITDNEQNNIKTNDVFGAQHEQVQHEQAQEISGKVVIPLVEEKEEESAKNEPEELKNQETEVPFNPQEFKRVDEDLDNSPLEMNSFSFSHQNEKKKDFMTKKKEVQERLKERISKRETYSATNSGFIVDRITADPNANENEKRAEEEKLHSDEKYTSRDTVEYDMENNEMIIKENSRYIDKRED